MVAAATRFSESDVCLYHLPYTFIFLSYSISLFFPYTPYYHHIHLQSLTFLFMLSYTYKLLS